MANIVGFQCTAASQQTISEYSRRELQEAFSKFDPEGTGVTSIKNLKVNFFLRVLCTGYIIIDPFWKWVYFNKASMRFEFIDEIGYCSGRKSFHFRQFFDHLVLSHEMMKYEF